MTKALILNPGSTSLKYSVFLDSKTLIAKENLNINEVDIKQMVQQVDNHLEKVIVRVVHGWIHFIKPTRVDAAVIKKLQSFSDLAPLHNPPAIKILESLLQIWVSDLWAVFDTSFHATIPSHASSYALPKDLTETYHIKRYGFHGISHQYVSKTLQKRDPSIQKIISLHLGGGSSVTAIKNGKSIDTSMGFTPVSGVIMKTRSWSIDPGVILYLMNHVGMSSDEISTMLNSESGLTGLSDAHLDSRELTNLSQKWMKEAKEILQMYIYSIVKYIGSYYVALGWVDAIIFTGGIGENNAYIRNAICEQLTTLGIYLNTDRVDRDSYEDDTLISDRNATVQVWVIPTDEEKQMLQEVEKIRQTLP